MNTEQQLCFETEWEAIRDRVLGFCRRIGGSVDRGEEIFQRTSIRVWRGFNGFRKESSFLSWACMIARHEADTLFAKEIAEATRGFSVINIGGRMDAPFEPIKGTSMHRLVAILTMAASNAVTTGYISETESNVILAKLKHEDATWGEIGDSLSLTANACAAAHCRAIPKLRVYLFAHHQEALGGMRAIEAAFQEAVVDAVDPLTPNEQAAFREVILNRVMGYRRRGWLESLRSACLKVIHKLAVSND